MVVPKLIILVGVTACVFAVVQTGPTFAKENGELLEEDQVIPNWWERKLADASGVLPGLMSAFGDDYDEQAENMDMRQLLGRRRRRGGRRRRRRGDDDGRRDDRRKLLGEDDVVDGDVSVDAVGDGRKLLGEVDFVDNNADDLASVKRSLLDDDGGRRGRRRRRGKKRRRRRGDDK